MPKAGTVTFCAHFAYFDELQNDLHWADLHDLNSQSYYFKGPRSANMIF